MFFFCHFQDKEDAPSGPDPKMAHEIFAETGQMLEHWQSGRGQQSHGQLGRHARMLLRPFPWYCRDLFEGSTRSGISVTFSPIFFPSVAMKTNACVC